MCVICKKLNKIKENKTLIDIGNKEIDLKPDVNTWKLVNSNDFMVYDFLNTNRFIFYRYKLLIIIIIINN